MEADPYCCANRQFIIDRDLMPETCEKYGITEDEFNEIAEKLKTVLAFGKCAWCE